ncbi:MAG: hypothetical protein IID43_06440, partial [Planctomycetes bacterium]|nr:hypothetical protein [Planctomycetota bacterium]
DTADVDNTLAGDPENEGIVNVNGVNATDDASDVGGPDAAKTAPDDDVADDEWGEI